MTRKDRTKPCQHRHVARVALVRWVCLTCGAGFDGQKAGASVPKETWEAFRQGRLNAGWTVTDEPGPLAVALWKREPAVVAPERRLRLFRYDEPANHPRWGPMNATGRAAA